MEVVKVLSASLTHVCPKMLRLPDLTSTVACASGFGSALLFTARRSQTTPRREDDDEEDEDSAASTTAATTAAAATAANDADKTLRQWPALLKCRPMPPV